MAQGNTGFWNAASQYMVGAPSTVPMPPVTNALVPTTGAGRYTSSTKTTHATTTAPQPNPLQMTASYNPAAYGPQPNYYGSMYMHQPQPPMYPGPYGYPGMPPYTPYPMPGHYNPMMYPQPAPQPVPRWTSNLQTTHASGMILSPLPYTPDEREKVEVPADTQDMASHRGAVADDIEHCMIFGMPGIDDGVFTYRGTLDNCTEVMNLLHSGKFKVGYKCIRPKSTQGDLRTSLELLFAQSSLESIPESGILPTDEEIEKERRFLHQRLHELHNVQDIKQKVKDEQLEIERKASTPKGLADIWSASASSLNTKGKK